MEPLFLPSTRWALHCGKKDQDYSLGISSCELLVHAPPSVSVQDGMQARASAQVRMQQCSHQCNVLGMAAHVVDHDQGL